MKNYKRDFEAHQKILRGAKLSVTDIIYFFSKIPFDLIESFLRNISGPLGFKLRYYFYKLFLKKIGKGVMIDTGVKLAGVKNISIGDYSYIESYTLITAFMEEIIIGRRVHIAPHCLIHANKKIWIGDYVGMGSGVKVYSSTTYPNEKRMNGPTIPKEMMSTRSKEIKIGKDAAIYVNAVILPGAIIGEGAVICAHSIISKKVEPYKIVLGNSKIVGKRRKVTQKDI